jgi:Zn finger protein HypA/HybF involved in hydrogenase expression
MKRITPDAFEEARENFMGWCPTCTAFTREETEGDAEKYDCPACDGEDVRGAEQALLLGDFELSKTVKL